MKMAANKLQCIAEKSIWDIFSSSLFPPQVAKRDPIRKKGRPRKVITPLHLDISKADSKIEKRKRGRPRKSNKKPDLKVIGNETKQISSVITLSSEDSESIFDFDIFSSAKTEKTPTKKKLNLPISHYESVFGISTVMKQNETPYLSAGAFHIVQNVAKSCLASKVNKDARLLAERIENDMNESSKRTEFTGVSEERPDEKEESDNEDPIVRMKRNFRVPEDLIMSKPWENQSRSSSSISQSQLPTDNSPFKGRTVATMKKSRFFALGDAETFFRNIGLQHASEAENDISQSSPSTEDQIWIGNQLYDRNKIPNSVKKLVSSDGFIGDRNIYGKTARRSLESLQQNSTPIVKDKKTPITKLKEPPKQPRVVIPFEENLPNDIYSLLDEKSDENLASLIEKLTRCHSLLNRITQKSPTPFQPALHKCISNGNIEGAYCLLLYGANPNQQFGENLTTALHVAVKNDSLPFARLLVRFGADVTLKNRANKMPEELCDDQQESLRQFLVTCRQRFLFSTEVIQQTPYLLNQLTDDDPFLGHFGDRSDMKFGDGEAIVNSKSKLPKLWNIKRCESTKRIFDHYKIPETKCSIPVIKFDDLSDLIRERPGGGRLLWQLEVFRVSINAVSLATSITPQQQSIDNGKITLMSSLKKTVIVVTVDERIRQFLNCSFN